MIDLTEIINDINIKGISIINYHLNDIDLLKLGNKLGKVIPDDNNNLIQHIRPNKKGDGTLGSFSYNYGYGDFPFHTDTSFWEIPAKFLLLTTEAPSTCNTSFISLTKLFTTLNNSDLIKFKRAIFLLKTFKGQRFTPLLLKSNDISLGLRYDSTIMTPYNKDAREALHIMENFIENQKIEEIVWTGKNLAIINNRLALHGRKGISKDINRVLKRIYIK